MIWVYKVIYNGPSVCSHFQCIIFNENICIWFKCSLGPVDSKWALVPEMAWWWTGSKPLSEPRLTKKWHVQYDFDKYISGIILGLGSANERCYTVVSHWLSPWPKFSLYIQDKCFFRYFTTDKKGQLCNDIVIFTVYQKSAATNIILSFSYRYRYHNH